MKKLLSYCFLAFRVLTVPDPSVLSFLRNRIREILKTYRSIANIAGSTSVIIPAWGERHCFYIKSWHSSPLIIENIIIILLISKLLF